MHCRWTKEITAVYKNIEVKDFDERFGSIFTPADCSFQTRRLTFPSFQNGLAFCAILHAHKATAVDYNTLVEVSSTNLRSLTCAVSSYSKPATRI